MPRRARDHVLAELDAWGRRAVFGHHEGERPWLPYHELVTAPVARLAGARPHEVVVMNSLTVNLHLMSVSFYRPTRRRHRIVVEQGAFPSDRYALLSQARFHGFPDAVVEVPRGEDAARSLDDSVALLLLGSPNFVTGEAFDIARLTAAAHERGCVAGFDLAHGIGNLELALRASLELFDAAGMHALREKSVRLTAYLEQLLRGVAEVLTPADPQRRGAMLTLRVPGDAARLLAALRARGAVCDARPPDVLRLSAPPLYTRFADVQRLATLLREELRHG